MADEQPPSPPGAPAAPPPPPPGEAYGSAQGAPPPASHPYGSPPTGESARPGFPAGPPPPESVPVPYGVPTGPGAPPPYPARPVGTPEQIAHARRLARLALVTAVTAPLVSLLQLPYTTVLGLGFGLLAIVLGVRARRAAVVAHHSEAGGVVAIVLGSVGLAFIGVVIATYIVFWGEVTSYQDCMSGANTKQAERSCSDQLVDDARRRIGLD